MSLNYAKHQIPFVNDLLEKAKESLNLVSTSKKHQFDELFLQQNSGEYYRNDEIFEKLYNTKKNEKEDKKENEIRGVYVFHEQDKPVYVGVSRKILTRLKNHFIGKTHNQASLTYLMSREKYDKEHGLFMQTRNEFPFEEYRHKHQNEMKENWRISIIPIKDNYEMYFTEFYLACELKTEWNSFETH